MTVPSPYTILCRTPREARLVLPTLVDGGSLLRGGRGFVATGVATSFLNRDANTAE
jgi:hypothetical protein